jgi:hypothetical protein
MFVRFVGVLIVLLLSKVLVQAQERCGTVPYMQYLFEKKNIKQDTEQFERWLQAKTAQRKQRLQAQRQQSGPYKIPVVIHIVHNGEPEGVGTNLSDEQILSQIDVLNNDFQRLNADAVNTPIEFVPVAGTLDIEFVMAKQTPDGLPTTGIIRVDGNKASWSPFDEDLNAISYWPSEDYLNIWVTNIGSDFLGYAQFPVSNLQGLEEFQDGIAETDGVVIDYTVFGFGSSNPDYNLGRSTTHEVGHFFGLRHIWGDNDDCIQDDYVSDTPLQEDETYGCELHPESDACSSMKMFQNYMDYTDDLCMNLFTQDQVDRMITILEDTDVPRRNSLLTSIGLEDPIAGIIDLEINDVTNPGPVTCDETPFLKINVTNLSDEVITSLKVKITVNDSSPLTFVFTGLMITESAELSMPVQTLSIGENVVSVNVIQINGASDPVPSNNMLDVDVYLIYPECEPFAIYTNTQDESQITFDLPQPSSVKINILNTMGQLLSTHTLSDVLNQTYTFPSGIQSGGIYIFRIQIGTTYYSQKVYLYR